MLSSDKSPLNYSTVIPADIAAIFGPPPVLATEPREAYERLFIELVLEWGPSKTTEWLLVRDIADLKLGNFAPPPCDCECAQNFF